MKLIPQKNLCIQFMTFLCVKLSSFHTRKKTTYFSTNVVNLFVLYLDFLISTLCTLTLRISSLNNFTREVIKNKGHCLDMNNNICVQQFFNKIYRSIFSQNGFVQQLVFWLNEICALCVVALSFDFMLWSRLSKLENHFYLAYKYKKCTFLCPQSLD